MKFKATLTALGLMAFAATMTGCATHDYVKQPKNGFHAKVLKVVTPGKLLVEFYPKKEIETSMDDVEDAVDELMGDMDGKIYVEYADINIPMSKFECDKAWSTHQIIQDINHYLNGHATDSYGTPAYNFDHLCKVQKDTLEGQYISVEMTELDKPNDYVKGHVFRLGEHYNSKLVAQGYALYDHKQTHDMSYRVAQEKAFNSKSGLWALVPNECGFSLETHTRCPAREVQPSNHK